MPSQDYSRIVLYRSIKGLSSPKESVVHVFRQGSIVIAL
jgi:hypothetical protein